VTDDAVQHVMLLGHNPGMHALAVLLAADYVREADAERVIHGFPTCGLMSMTCALPRWRDLQPQSATVDALHFSSGV